MKSLKDFIYEEGEAPAGAPAAPVGGDPGYSTPLNTMGMGNPSLPDQQHNGVGSGDGFTRKTAKTRKKKWKKFIKGL